MQSYIDQTKPMAMQNAGSVRPVLAYLNMSIHEDGEFTVKASESLKTCADHRLKQQLLKAHHTHIASGKSISKRQKTVRGRVNTKIQDSDGEDAPPRMTREYPYQLNASMSSDTARGTQLSFSHESVNDYQSDGDATPRPIRQDRSFCIRESDRVTDFLCDQLRHMQQNAVKRLAKAWIKGICPKKQAKFPYHEAQAVPDWWPPIELCPFKEPDHIKKEQRLSLCMHLLRLRPKQGDLQKWNDDLRMPGAPYDRGGWTQFLKDIAPIEVIKDLREPEELNELRIGFLAELYKVAEKEEEYLKSGVDGNDKYLPTEAPHERSFEIRRAARNRQAQAISDNNIPQKRGHKDSTISALPNPSQSSVINHVVDVKVDPIDEKPKRKKQRRNSGTSGQTSAIATESKKPSSSQRRKSSTKDSRQGIDTCAMSPYVESMMTPVTTSAAWQPIAHSMRAADDINTSFSSSTASFCAPTDSFMAGHGLPPMAMRGFHTDIPLHPSTYAVTSIPQPTFRTVPNSPVQPHPSLFGLPMDHRAAISASSQPHPWTLSAYAPTMSFGSTVYDDQSSTSQPPQSSMMTRASSDSIYSQQAGWSNYSHAPSTMAPSMRPSISQAAGTPLGYDQY